MSDHEATITIATRKIEKQLLSSSIKLEVHLLFIRAKLLPLVVTSSEILKQDFKTPATKPN